VPRWPEHSRHPTEGDVDGVRETASCLPQLRTRARPPSVGPREGQQRAHVPHVSHGLYIALINSLVLP
jgi:hypothetical protein